MQIEAIIPWESPDWDAFVDFHPGATVYHTSAWIRLVAGIGGYEPACFVARDGDRVTGVLPAVIVRSRLTGNRLTTLPFSDECGPLARDAGTATALLDAAGALRERESLAFHELRAAPATLEGASHVPESYAASGHFSTFTIPLSPDSESVRKTFSRKSVRQTISKGERLGVTVRRGRGEGDIDTFYRLYALNRRRHGIPPQPVALFRRIFETLNNNRVQSLLYMAEAEGRAVASLIIMRYRGVALAKYEGVDERARQLLPIYPLFWATIRDACEFGDTQYDFGRTAHDNRGLMEFKSRWGTEARELPYYFSPPGQGLSVVSSDSLKYRLFTGTFRNLPLGMGTWLGARIFRHFG